VAAGPLRDRALTALLLRRLGAALVLVFLVVTATFFLLHLPPGSPVALLDDPRVPRSQRQELIALWGLDEPLPVQYGRWLRGVVLAADWGTSFTYQRPAAAVVMEAIPNTLLLGGAALAIQLMVALPLGLWSARRPGTRRDHLVRAGSLALYAMPTFWFGLMALLLFSYRWPLFPPSHLQRVGAQELGTAERWLDLAHHLALPALVLGLPAAGGLVRFLRSGLLEVFPREHLLAARARGLGERRVLWLHAMRSALGPLVQILGLSLPALLSGALVTEVLFAWPGLGRLAYAALLDRDYPLILACTSWSALLVVLGTLLADLLLAAVDPRVRDAR
jgi:peptide/nickel transport system permease protein